MRNRHRGVFIQEQLDQRTADQIGAADDDRVHAFQRGMHGFGKHDAAERRARRKRRKAGGQPSGVVRMQSVDVLGGVDGVDDGFSMQRLRQRQLHENAVHGGIAIELCHQRQQIALSDIRRQHVLERRHAGGLGLLMLAADIDLTRRIAADQHHRKPGCQAMLALHARDLLGNAGAKLRCNDLAVDDPGRHLGSFCSQ